MSDSDRPELDGFEHGVIEKGLNDFIEWLDANPEKDPLDYDAWLKVKAKGTS